MKVLLTAAALAAAALAASVAPALGDDTGSVAARVTVSAPCIEVTPTSLDFGTLGLSPSVASAVTAARPLSAENCGTSSQNLLARGTNATSTGGTTWTLEPNRSDLCSTPNRFEQRVDTGPGSVSVPLTTVNTAVGSLPGGATSSVNAHVAMPCAGSSGAGEVMTFSYVFTAVLG